MRANWITALLSGIAFGALLGCLRRYTTVVTYVLPFAFFGSVVLCAIGAPQLKELLALQKKYGPISFSTRIDGELGKVVIPLWGRVATWFVSTAVVAIAQSGA